MRASRLQPLVADLRDPRECDRVVAATRERFGKIDILVNNAGLTFTYIDPARFRRDSLQRFWQVDDEVIDNVITTKLSRRRPAGAAGRAGDGRSGRMGPHRQRDDQARHEEPGRHAPLRRGEGGARDGDRGVGQADAAGTGLTVNIVNPGAGANTAGHG